MSNITNNSNKLKYKKLEIHTNIMLSNVLQF